MLPLLLCLVAFTQIMPLTAAGKSHETVRREYLSYEALSDANRPQYHHTADITVTCYWNMRWWVCPNPLDDERSQSLENQYDQGWYVEKETFAITRRQYDDDALWNS